MLGVPSASTAAEKRKRPPPFQVRATESEIAHWAAASRAAGSRSTSDWARSHLNALAKARTGGVAPPIRDKDFDDALDYVARSLGMFDPAQAMRSGIVKFARLLREARKHPGILEVLLTPDDDGDAARKGRA